ncbi:MAG: hypothetical protein HQK60_10690 [Deltaproteobacteria bacterium]|nr:hypothetical protein [Deltaproteobacteria bacterium]
MPINIIRYLFMLRVTGSLVTLSDHPALELSRVVGNAIANRLPTSQARPWRKAVTLWDQSGLRPQDLKKGLTSLPEVNWPIEAVIFFYPGKRAYGFDELIFWELKLLGDSADHNLFLEVIMPALEEACTAGDPRWRSSLGLWGRSGIQAVYVARGLHWEPLVQQGQLDLGYKPGPTQWAEGLDFDSCSSLAFDQLTWVTPFHFASPGANPQHPQGPARPSLNRAPTLRQLYDAFVARVSPLILNKRHPSDTFWNLLTKQDQLSLEAAIEQSSRVRLSFKAFKSGRTQTPEAFFGMQRFAPVIPQVIVPLLGLGSIIHLGRHTHLGHGTFYLDSAIS